MKQFMSSVPSHPFGPVGEWTWGNSTAGSPNLHTRYFDLDGRIGKIEAGASIDARQYAIDIAHRITGIDTLVSGSVDPTRSFTYGYDNLDRLTSQTPQAGNPGPMKGVSVICFKRSVSACPATYASSWIELRCIWYDADTTASRDPAARKNSRASSTAKHRG